jgi:inosose dehydratase
MKNKIKIGFSLDMINMHHQEPNRNRQESKYYWEELYPLIVASGFSGVEIPFDPFWIFRGGSGVPFTKYCVEIKYGDVNTYLNYLKGKGIDKIAGIHFDPTMFMRNNNLDFYFGASGHFGREAVKYAIELGCEYINVTPTPAYGLVKHYHGIKIEEENWTADFLSKTAQMINEFAEIAKQGGVKIALRNEYWSLLRGDKILKFMSQLDSSVRMDMDPAHALIAGQDPLRQLKDRADLLGSVHLTDTSFKDNDAIWKTPNPQFPSTGATQVFRDIGFGTIDLKSFYETLEDVGYEGWVICSCRQTRDPMRALLRTRSFINTNLLTLERT